MTIITVKDTKNFIDPESLKEKKQEEKKVAKTLPKTIKFTRPQIKAPRREKTPFCASKTLFYILLTTVILLSCFIVCMFVAGLMIRMEQARKYEALMASNDYTTTTTTDATTDEIMTEEDQGRMYRYIVFIYNTVQDGVRSIGIGIFKVKTTESDYDDKVITQL
jgi:hypothetical protein